MKRTLESISSGGELNECREEHLGATENWNFFEDQALAKIAAKASSLKWLEISEELNTMFKENKRSPLECRARWAVLQKEQIPEISWTEQEEILLMLSLNQIKEIHELVPILKTKSIDQIRKHILYQLKISLDNIKENKFIDQKITSLSILKNLFFNKFLLEIQTSPLKFPEIIKEITASGLNSKHILDSVSRIAKNIGIEQEWTEKILTDYIEHILENIENEMEAKWTDKTEEDETFEGLILKPKTVVEQDTEPNVLVIFRIMPNENNNS